MSEWRGGRMRTRLRDSLGSIPTSIENPAEHSASSLLRQFLVHSVIKTEATRPATGNYLASLRSRARFDPPDTAFLSFLFILIFVFVLLERGGSDQNHGNTLCSISPHDYPKLAEDFNIISKEYHGYQEVK